MRFCKKIEGKTKMDRKRCEVKTNSNTGKTIRIARGSQKIEQPRMSAARAQGLNKRG